MRRVDSRLVMLSVVFIAAILASSPVIAASAAAAKAAAEKAARASPATTENWTLWECADSTLAHYTAAGSPTALTSSPQSSFGTPK